MDQAVEPGCFDRCLPKKFFDRDIRQLDKGTQEGFASSYIRCDLDVERSL